MECVALKICGGTAFGARFINYTPMTLTRMNLQFTGEVWRQSNLPKTLQDQILDYKLMIYFCSGTDKERLDWFRIINIAGVQLTNQELRTGN